MRQLWLPVVIASAAAAGLLWGAAQIAGAESCSDWFPADGSGWRYCASSYRAPSGEAQFGPDRMQTNIGCCREGAARAAVREQAPPLPWIAGSSRAGIGEWVRLDFRHRAIFSALYLINGWADPNDEKRFRQHNRLKEIVLEASDGSRVSVMLRDTPVRQRIRFGKALEANWIKLTVVSIYSGGEGEHTALWTVYPDFASP
jgi:hypothetical protein